MGRNPKSKGQRKGSFATFRMDAAMNQQLEELAVKRDVPKTQLIREAVKEYLAKAA